MKKLALIFGMMFSVACLSGTEQEICSKIDSFVSGYETNKILLLSFESVVNNPELCSRIDEKLKDTPPLNFIYNRNFEHFPKTALASRISANSELGFTIYENVTGKDLAMYDSPKIRLERDLYMIDIAGRFDQFVYDMIAKNSYSLVSRSIRRKLRKEGKSILVDKNGNDPCKPYLDGISAALEAPRFAGLSNALENCGVSVRVPEKYRFYESCFSDSWISRMTNAIYFGDVEFTDFRQSTLKFVLGTKEYNKFVERYNGKSN